LRDIAKLSELLRKPSNKGLALDRQFLVAYHVPQNASLAPGPQFDVTVHIVVDDFGQSGRAYRETAEEAADFKTVVDDLIAGQFNNPIRVIAFNVSEGWSRDVGSRCLGTA
jgi:hypothetical protein